MHGKNFFVHFFIMAKAIAFAEAGLTGFIVLCVVGPLGKGGWRTKFFLKSETENDESEQKSN
jgi:hypothetical protein